MYPISGLTPIHYAIHFPTVFNRLVDAGADVYATTYDGENILHGLNYNNLTSGSNEIMERYPQLVNQKTCTGTLHFQAWLNIIMKLK